jgi:hypothetical protein
MEQRARLEYFLGKVGSRRENLAPRFVFQMQDHYLAPEHPASRWGPELDHRLKGDVAPDDLSFDLDEIERIAGRHDIHGFFADRLDPVLIEDGGRRYVVPNGSNFAIRTDVLRSAGVQAACRRMLRVYGLERELTHWLTFCEYNWGRVLFHEGRRFYDVKRDRVYDEWDPAEFSDAMSDYRWHFARFDAELRRGLLSGLARPGRRAFRRWMPPLRSSP